MAKASTFSDRMHVRQTLEKHGIEILNAKSLGTSMSELERKYGISAKVLSAWMYRGDREVFDNKNNIDLLPRAAVSHEDIKLTGIPFEIGYEAWNLVHEKGLSVKDAMKRLNLKFTSQVYELLAKHKKAIEKDREIAMSRLAKGNLKLCKK